MPDFAPYCRCPGCGQCSAAQTLPKLQDKCTQLGKTIRTLSAQLRELKAEQDEVIRRADIRIGWHARVRMEIEDAFEKVKHLLQEIDRAELDDVAGLIKEAILTIESIKPPNRDLP